jgi:hypothetical protein
MMDQDIILTALPNGFVEKGGKKHLKLSIYVSPRMKPSSPEEGDLSHFPDFKNWTDKVGSMNFRIQFAPDPAKAARAKISDPSVLDQKMWSKIFRKDAYIKPYKFDDYSQQMIISYSVRDLESFIQRTYQKIGWESGGNLPIVPDLLEYGLGEIPPDCIHWNDEIARKHHREQFRAFAAYLARRNEKPNNDTSTIRSGNLNTDSQGGESAFENFMLFHQKPINAPKDPIKMPSQENFDKYLDFHQVISSLGDYPEIMRRLGLIIDITVSADEEGVPSLTQPQSGELKVVTDWKSFLGRSPITPSTAFILDESRFETAPRPNAAPSKPEIVDGLLRLDPKLYGLVSMDVDGAAFKMVHTALSLENLGSSAPPVNMPEEAGLATIRSGGISLVNSGRASKIYDKFWNVNQHNTDLTAGNPPSLHAEDTLRGYRIDIWDSLSGQWHSLCKRIGEYRFEGSELHPLIIGDEGYVQMSMTQAPTPPNSEPSELNDLYLTESMLRWEGWSLVAPRPGRSISADPNALPQSPKNDPITQFKLKTSFKAAPGSLPKLRFGSRYKLRARVVDLAGNSVSLEDAPEDSDMILPEDPLGLKYLRYDPVIAPVVINRWPMHPDTKPGESLERLVIRSNNSDPSLDGKPTIQNSDRHIAPPRTSQLMAEVHGMFDLPSDGLKSDRNTYNMMVDKDRGTFGAGPNPPVRPEDILKLSYLPDPLARGAALRNLPGTADGTIWRPNEKKILMSTELPGVRVRPGSVTMIDFGPVSSWPNAQPFRIILVEGSAYPQWDEKKRLLTVQLPKAGMATIPLSAYIEEEDLKIMGVWQWIKEYVDELVAKSASSTSMVSEIQELSGKLADLSQLALEGGFWMLTPYRKIVLVHAVQQPIGRPEFKELFAIRGSGSSFAHLEGEIKVHGMSTMKLDIAAEWQEPVDLPEPGMRSGKAHVEEVPLPILDWQEPMILISGGRPVGRYMPETDTIRFCPDLDPSLPLKPPLEPRHEFNDTKHRIVRYRATATSRFREYFPPPKLPDPDYFTRTSEEILVSVPSSARPAAPRVLYVVPTFGWKRQTSTNLKACERLGGGLRVYLDRPWFSSGEGELLGVVMLQDIAGFLNLSPENRNAMRDRNKHYITQWGTDPIWATDSVSPLPDIVNFPGSEKDVPGSYINLSLEETSEIKVQVAGHNVAYDPNRKLWYCDIEVDTGNSYYPFIRMALARYQPSSIDGAELSRVVLADYAQVAPNRSVVITYDPYNPDVINVAVAGITYRTPSTPSDISSIIEISIESRREDIGGDLGWEAATGASVIQDAAKTLPLPGSGNLLWKGLAQLPSGHAPEQKFRLVIKEYERLFKGYEIESKEIDKRLVFAEIIEL